ncbi:hypothetical protein COCC4DRAFT_61481 [Bipolaris maydis ATCC 48331]|uniref:Major facilitator superfamily (MFS) profile domain-containing protein n=2 Tax=Cochliobolus heterostrophus TaxID=5016 RepID=M2UYA1_COCH5|nr:uncharacterized protein COCC4DRAFT_61481 [Bipolaris maydis ATCC 48331]EMD92742.1 hypothetical protein COCHEDRAFT_1212574 [Bipolaris maydis C5]KAJ5020550.1 major facilitator superfamily domain-containing protein [Bipolaris maydis]ENI04868.1 hypothetical protein COCC4DRAFT_61481 [Bipolaris maydis ATCC 48331]KAJ5056706.1 major facilitator superfamily domain-containing protein [Bipolaris maydis]KAJ6208397.1 major facilitator superfamily domain-containing protein [Bipolaris maydis]
MPSWTAAPANIAERRTAADAIILHQTNHLPRKKLLIVFSVLAISHIVCFIDQTGIGVALSTIGRELNAEDTISWAGTSALIANTIFHVLYGRMSDLFGRKSVLITALVLLSISSLLCGLALNATMLYAFRALSGVANGGIVSLSSMIVSDIVTLKERGKWQGMIGACVGIGNMSGPFIAAAFVQKSTWRGFFWLLSPVAAVCAVLCMFVLPTPVHQPRTDAKTVMKRIDYGGIFFGSAALLLLLIPVAGGGDYFNWDSPMVISMMVLGGCCVLVFVYIEHRVAVLPMMPLTLFKSGPVSVMLIQNFLFGMVAYSQTYYLPLFMQNARRFSPIISACLMLPIYALQMLSSIASGQYMSRFGRYGEVIWAGFSLWTLGVGLTCVFSLDTPLWAIIIILAIQGIGIGAVFQPVLVALQAHCSKAHRAIVISNRNFIRSLGGAVGLAVSAAALQNSLQSAMPAEFRSLTLSSYDTPPFETLNDTQIRLILNGYATASRTVFIVNVPLMVLCLIGCFFIKDEGLLQQEGEDNDIEKTISRDGVSSHTGR